jgi:glutaredoxin
VRALCDFGYTRCICLTLDAISVVAAVALICLAIAPAQAACGTNAITLHSAYWCGICKQVRTFFAQYHIRYNLIEVTNNTRVQEYMLSHFGIISVPWTVIGGAVVKGHDPERMKKLLCIS